VKPERIIIHHSLTKDSVTVSWSAIRRYHKFNLRWSDIGYHAGIEFVKEAIECFYGRPVTKRGAHTIGANNDSLGFCFVGNFDLEAPSHQLLYIAAERVLAPWMITYGIQIENVFPHRAFAPHKSCPGEMFDMEQLKDILKSLLPT